MSARRWTPTYTQVLNRPYIPGGRNSGIELNIDWMDYTLSFDRLQKWDEAFGEDRDRRYARMYNVFSKQTETYEGLNEVRCLQILLWWYYGVFIHPTRRKGVWGAPSEEDGIGAYMQLLTDEWNKRDQKYTWALALPGLVTSELGESVQRDEE